MTKRGKRGRGSDDKIRYLDGARAEGWAQQEQFQRVIARVDNESDRMVQLLRTLRMCVMPRGGMLGEQEWKLILMAAEAIIDMEKHSEARASGETMTEMNDEEE